MTSQETVKTLCDVGIIPVVRAKSADVLVDLSKALIAGGVPVAEVTMTVPGAIDGIRRLVKTFGKDLLVGVGSVTEARQAEEAADAGAEFIVGPVLVPEVIQAARTRGKAVIPGAFTPTEIFQAHQLGADVIRVFPASVGGPEARARPVFLWTRPDRQTIRDRVSVRGGKPACRAIHGGGPCETAILGSWAAWPQSS